MTKEDIRVAYHAITWRDEFIRALDEIAEVGYSAFETFASIVNDYRDRLEEFQDIIAQRGLRISSLYGGGSYIYPAKVEEDIDWNVTVARFLAANGADRLVLGGGARRPEGNSLEDYKLMAQTIEEIGKRSLDLGVRACLHPHWRNAVETREEIKLIMELADPKYIFLCPDAAHLVKGGSDPVEVFTTYAERIAYVHFKDIPWRPEEAVPSDEVSDTTYVPGFLELGEGSIDFPAVLDVLKNHSYEGWISIELDTTERTPKESAAISKAYMEKVLKLKV